MTSRLQDYLKAQTLHQAVNVLLLAISSAPVSSLEAVDTNTDAESALTHIGEAMRELQTEGWVWNQEIALELTKNGDGHIVLPANTLRVIQLYTPDTSRKRLVWRGNKLYDALNHTYNIGYPVKVDLTVALDFDQMPSAARQYVALKAVRRFTSGKVVSSSVYQVTKADEDTARLRMEQEAAEMDPDSMLQNPQWRRNRRGSVWGSVSSASQGVD